jgi:hypothetical protein
MKVATLLKAAIVFSLISFVNVKSHAVIRGGYIEWEVVNNDSINVLFNVYYDCNFFGISNTFKISTDKCGDKAFSSYNLPKPTIVDVNFDCKQSCNWNQLKRKTFLLGLRVDTFRRQNCCDINLIMYGQYRNDSSNLREPYYYESQINVCDTTHLKSFKWSREVINTIGYRQPIMMDLSASFNSKANNVSYKFDTARTNYGKAAKYSKGGNTRNPFRYLGYPNYSRRFPQGFNIFDSTGIVAFTLDDDDSYFNVKAEYKVNGKTLHYITREVYFESKRYKNSQPPNISGINNTRNNLSENFETDLCPGVKSKFFILVNDADKDSLSIDIKTNLPNCNYFISPGPKGTDTVWFECLASFNDVGEAYLINVLAMDNRCGKRRRVSVALRIKVNNKSKLKFTGTNKKLSCDEYRFELAENNDKNYYETIWKVGQDTIGKGSKIKHQFRSKGIFNVVAITNACQNHIDSQKVNITAVNDLKLLNINDTSVCAGDSLILEPKAKGGSGVNTLNFTHSYSGLVRDTVNSQSFRGVFSQNANYPNLDMAIELYDTNGCSLIENVKIKVFKSEGVSWLNDTLICDKTSYNYKLDDALKGIWQSEQPILNGFVKLNLSDTGIHSLYYTEIGQSQCYHDMMKIAFSSPIKIDAGSNIDICETVDSLVLKAKPKGGKWSLDGMTSKTTFSPLKMGIGSFYNVYSFRNSYGCLAFDSIKIEIVNTRPQAEAPDSAVYCNNYGEFLLVAKPLSGIWLENNLGSLPNELVLNTKDFKAGNYSLVFYNIDRFQCYNTDTTHLRILASPKINYTLNKTQLYVDDTLKISAKHNANLPQTHEWKFIKDDDTLSQSSGAQVEFVPKTLGIYEIHYFTQFDDNGCQNFDIDTNAFEVILPTTLAKENKDEIRIYPTINGGSFAIQSQFEIKQIIVTSFDGRTIESEQLNEENRTLISLIDDISNGIYFIHFESNNRTFIEKIIIQNEN